MNINTARWALISCWDRTTLDELHRRELLLVERCDILRGQGKSPVNCNDQAYMELQTQKLSLTPWWVDTDPAMEKQRMDEFERFIFPIWKNIEERASKEEDAQLTLHRQDIAIYESGFKINRFGGNPQYEKKAKLKSKYEEVMGG